MQSREPKQVCERGTKLSQILFREGNIKNKAGGVRFSFTFLFKCDKK